MIRRGSHLSDQCHKIAVDAIGAAKHPHHFIGVTKQGVTAVIETTGNDCCHVILRGGTEPNYSAEHVAQVHNATIALACHSLQCSALMEKAGLLPRVMIDCSHGNSRKNHKNQPVVLKDVVSTPHVHTTATKRRPSHLSATPNGTLPHCTVC